MLSTCTLLIQTGYIYRVNISVHRLFEIGKVLKGIGTNLCDISDLMPLIAFVIFPFESLYFCEVHLFRSVLIMRMISCKY